MIAELHVGSVEVDNVCSGNNNDSQLVHDVVQLLNFPVDYWISGGVGQNLEGIRGQAWALGVAESKSWECQLGFVVGCIMIDHSAIGKAFDFIAVSGISNCSVVIDVVIGGQVHGCVIIVILAVVHLG